MKPIYMAVPPRPPWLATSFHSWSHGVVTRLHKVHRWSKSVTKRSDGLWERRNLRMLRDVHHCAFTAHILAVLSFAPCFVVL